MQVAQAEDKVNATGAELLSRSSSSGVAAPQAAAMGQQPVVRRLMGHCEQIKNLELMVAFPFPRVVCSCLGRFGLLENELLHECNSQVRESQALLEYRNRLDATGTSIVASVGPHQADEQNVVAGREGMPAVRSSSLVHERVRAIETQPSAAPISAAQQTAMGALAPPHEPARSVANATVVVVDEMAARLSKKAIGAEIHLLTKQLAQTRVTQVACAEIEHIRAHPPFDMEDSTAGTASDTADAAMLEGAVVPVTVPADERQSASELMESALAAKVASTELAGRLSVLSGECDEYREQIHVLGGKLTELRKQNAAGTVATVAAESRLREVEAGFAAETAEREQRLAESVEMFEGEIGRWVQQKLQAEAQLVALGDQNERAVRALELQLEAAFVERREVEKAQRLAEKHVEEQSSKMAAWASRCASG